jgi:hypothetical protein
LVLCKELLRAKRDQKTALPIVDVLDHVSISSKNLTTSLPIGF